jgi:hypothetical protein
MRVTTLAKKRQSTDDLIDALVLVRRKQPNEIIHTFPFLTIALEESQKRTKKPSILELPDFMGSCLLARLNQKLPS